MTKKVKTFISIFAAFIILIIVINFAIFYEPSRNTVEDQFTNKQSGNTNMSGLSDELIKEIEENRNQTIDLLASNYINEEKVIDFEIVSEGPGTKNARIVVEAKTTNKKSGFTTISKESYEVSLVKIGNSWKIDKYVLINSQTEQEK